MRKKDPRKEKAIYQAVLSICRQRGLNAITMAEIAKEAGIAAGTLYIYFKSKEDLIQEMYESILRNRSQTLLDELDVSGTLEKSFENYWFTYLEYLLEHTDQLYFLKQFQLLYSGKNIANEHFTYIGALQDMITKGINEGKIEKGPIPIKTAFVLRSLEEMVFAHSRKELVLDQKGIAEAFRMATESIFTNK